MADLSSVWGPQAAAMFGGEDPSTTGNVGYGPRAPSFQPNRTPQSMPQQGMMAQQPPMGPPSQGYDPVSHAAQYLPGGLPPAMVQQQPVAQRKTTGNKDSYGKLLTVVAVAVIGVFVLDRFMTK